MFMHEFIRAISLRVEEDVLPRWVRSTPQPSPLSEIVITNGNTWTVIIVATD